MSEPTTANQGFIVPNTGDLSGAWGTSAVNVNMNQLDGLFGGLLSLSFSAATTIALTNNGASITPGVGPNQSSNAAMFLSGTQTGNAIIQLSVPQVYRVINNCTPNSFYVQLAPATGTGLKQGVPPGEVHDYWFDGINIFMLNMPHVGSYMNLGMGAAPAWFGACTIAPWLVCNGSTFSNSSFAFLSAYLGSTYGGNGVTTFGVPDMQSRVYLMQDITGVNRVTSGGSGISGNTINASGGNELLQSHTHPNTLSDPGHLHSVGGYGGSGTGLPVNASGVTLTSVTGTSTTGITINNVSQGGGSSQNMPPALVGGLTYIKT